MAPRLSTTVACFVLARSALCIDHTGRLLQEVGVARDMAATLGPTGCFYFNVAFQGTLLPGYDPSPQQQESAVACQQLCQMQEGCAVFGFFPPSGACYLARADNLIGIHSEFGIAGPRVCVDPPPGCVDVPAAGFPAADASASNALWPSGVQPTNLQCWPRTQSQQPAACHSEQVTILDDHDTVGSCLGLEPVELPTNDTCEVNCAANIMCPSFQEVSTLANGKVSGGRECWQGLGENCWIPRGDFGQVAAKRFMHGHYRVLANIGKAQVFGLSRVSATESMNLSTVDAIRYCNHSCLSLLTCQFWQFSTKYGCWIEDPMRQKVPYPLTRHLFANNTDFAPTAVAGQYIQRLCGTFPWTESSLEIPGWELSWPGVDLTPAPPLPTHPAEDLGPRACSANPSCPPLEGMACCPTTAGAFLPCCLGFVANGLERPTTLEPVSATPVPDSAWCAANPNCPNIASQACCPDAFGAMLPCCSSNYEPPLSPALPLPNASCVAHSACPTLPGTDCCPDLWGSFLPCCSKIDESAMAAGGGGGEGGATAAG
eukprot:CAMPEP_0170278176 /NCGR_PEP_ID=MMETSP0116_2-20130129/39089_1 /TAXON_ID=400756 /ORGANISM="Durinskia baltica, Strain CSIRO CS-38" /LENGTH=543 /DNA_ID=CAMNT_0010529481 /DNA_START=95 /DNA_END=1722 /DNA_ORIENTATION=+